MRKVYNQAEKDAVEQPILKDGFSNDRFDKLYGKNKNPYLGSERDRLNKKNWRLNALLNRQDKKFDGEPWNWKKLKKNGNNKRTTKRTEEGKLGE